jgi:type I restriction enzyme R subunit
VGKPGPDSNEGRARIIDKLLEEAGWEIIREGDHIPDKGNYAVEEFQTDSGPMDYALIIDGKVLGDVEAKPETTGVPSVLQQNERYSKGYTKGKLEYDGGYHIPFLYASNGNIIWYRDARTKRNIQREIEQFHTPEAILEFLERDVEKSYQWLQENPIEISGIREYQKDAIESVEHAIMDNKRKLLLAMATGTGKTFTAAEMIYRLLKSKTAKRILFLVDRRVLAAQAVREFAAFEPEPGQKLDKLYEVYSQRFRKEDIGDEDFDPRVLPNEYLTDPKSNHTFIYVSTIQRMQINLFGGYGIIPGRGDEDIEDDADKLDIPIHAFDVVIADECHRGYTSSEESKWRDVLDHFDAIKIGLTATPAKHTTAYFKNVVYHYPVERAVLDGYLVDWALVKIESGIRMNGTFLKEGEAVEFIDTETGKTKYDELEDEREITTTQLEKQATVPDTNKKIVAEFGKFARKFEEQNGRFPKTIVFATQDMPHVSHAEKLVELLGDEFSEKGADFVKKITGKSDRPLQLIRFFRNRPIEPAIAVTVDLLSTGVDIPTAEAILFVRPVKSRILFEQMLGRGTRLAKDIAKTHFTVLDAVGVVDYFKNATTFPDPLPAKPSRSNKEVINDLANNKNRDYNTKILTRRLQRISKNISFAGRQQFELLTNQDIGKFAKNLAQNLEDDFSNTIKILQNDQFQYEMENYPRIKNDFIVALEEEDTVISTSFPIVVSGMEYKPSDYLQMFKKYIKKNPDKIEALSVLLKRPRDLNTDLLEDLRKKLALSKGQYTEEHLKRAYGTNLADIIGMIRSAISDEPLLTTKERVERALNLVVKGKKLSDQENQWIGFISNHLESNLLIEKQHFKTIPFSTKGGWKKANEDFGGQLEEIIVKINETMAS